MRMAVYVVPVALAVYALFDLYRSDPQERAGLRPLLWVLIIVLLPVVGPVTWLFVSAIRRNEAGTVGRAPGPSLDPRRPLRPTRRPGPVPPDDDPDFLRDLEEQWKRDGGAEADPHETDPPRT